MQSVPVCIQNNILVELPKAFQDELVTDGGLKLYQDTTFRPEWNATIQGKVVSVPKKITIGDGGNHSLDPDRPRIAPTVREGDELLFNYLVVMNRKEDTNAGDLYTKDDYRPDPYTTTWSAPNGMRIVRIYLGNDKFSVGLFNGQDRSWVARLDKVTEREVESFMGKYMPTQNIFFNYRNVLQCESGDYWMVDYANALAVKKQGGGFEMVGDYVILNPVREPHRGSYSGMLEIYEIAQDTDYRAIGEVVSIGPPLQNDKQLSVQPHDKVITDIRFVQKYTIDCKDYWIVRQKHIFGKCSEHDPTRNTQFH